MSDTAPGSSSTSMQFPQWLRTALHIETLFIMGAMITMAYMWWKYGSARKGLERLDEIAGEMLHVPKHLIRKKKAPRVYKHQERCRVIFQDVFGVAFKSVRPNWLKHPPTKKNLELDGFNQNIKTPLGRGLAFEYDGDQHSRYIPRFHPNGPQDFVYQRKKDAWKTLRCIENGILLIRIPSFVHYTDLERYIKQELRKKGMLRYSV